MHQLLPFCLFFSFCLKAVVCFGEKLVLSMLKHSNAYLPLIEIVIDVGRITTILYYIVTAGGPRSPKGHM